MALLILRRAALAAILPGLVLPGRMVAQAERPEYEVKSAYVLNFLGYATWPEGALESDGPLRLCTLGDDPFGDFLERATAGRSIRGHPIRLVQVDRVVEADRCHAAFIAERNRVPVAVWLERLRGRPILTIGEGEDFDEAGGMIALVVEARTVRFDINRTALQEVGLGLSSRVLRLARNRGDE